MKGPAAQEAAVSLTYNKNRFYFNQTLAILTYLRFENNTTHVILCIFKGEQRTAYIILLYTIFFEPLFVLGALLMDNIEHLIVTVVLIYAVFLLSFEITRCEFAK